MARSKKTENELRNRLKLTLNALCDESERVTDYCGPVEYGLDLVSVKKDIFRKLRCYGIQIKNGNISCKGKPNQKIKEIIGQLAIAFGKEINVDGVSYRLDGFYVIAYGEINTFAMDYINSASKGIRNLHFIDGRSLNEFLSKYGPRADVLKQT